MQVSLSSLPNLLLHLRTALHRNSVPGLVHHGLGATAQRQ